ncbi:hypothetical protein BDZ85DRAFT_252394 [Elsinoe ampelina]|uniref:Protein kinase domain-containing protein n=1 Tax=Elsinoe ampelina TaxID=302913 RepID=A0A6A6G2S8_9PEZI|nr:hypothetical protein BDZ85DRAFT_252394 [Elsinoe ampelina]
MQFLQIPDEEIYPTVRQAQFPLIIATELCNDYQYFVNRPKIHYMHAGIDIANDFSTDVRTWESLRSLLRHDRLNRCFGCLSQRNRVVGYVTERHTEDLSVIMRTQPRRFLGFNVDAIMADIRAGISHLHSHGLAHNWLMPEHIVLDKQDRAVIIHLQDYHHEATTHYRSTAIKQLFIEEATANRLSQHACCQAPESIPSSFFARPTGIPPLHGVSAQSHARTMPSPATARNTSTGSQEVGVEFHGNTDYAAAASCDGSTTEGPRSAEQI